MGSITGPCPKIDGRMLTMPSERALVGSSFYSLSNHRSQHSNSAMGGALASAQTHLSLFHSQLMTHPRKTIGIHQSPNASNKKSRCEWKWCGFTQLTDSIICSAIGSPCGQGLCPAHHCILVEEPRWSHHIPFDVAAGSSHHCHFGRMACPNRYLVTCQGHDLAVSGGQYRASGARREEMRLLAARQTQAQAGPLTTPLLPDIFPGINLNDQATMLHTCPLLKLTSAEP